MDLVAAATHRIPSGLRSGYLGATLVLTAGYFVAPVAQPFIYLALGWSAVAAIVAGVLCYRPVPATPWWLLAGGLALSGTGDLTWELYPRVFGAETPFPSLADAFYLAGYGFFIAGVVVLLRSGRRITIADYLDAAFVSTAAALIVWLVAIEPQLDAGAADDLALFVSGAYPALDAVLLVALVQLLVTSAIRTRALRCATASLALLVAADLVYVPLSLSGSYETGSLLDAGWLISYALLGAAGLDASMRDVRSIPRRVDDKRPWTRLALIAVPWFGIPVALMSDQLGGEVLGGLAIAAAAAAIAVLGFVRLALLFRERLSAQASTQLLAAIVESQTEAIMSTALDGSIQTWNVGAEKMYGYTAAEAIGMPLAELVPPGLEHEPPELWARLARGDQVVGHETVRRRKDGSVFDAILTISPLKDLEGQIVGSSAIVRDITEQKRLEEHLGLVQKLEAIGQLAGGVAHDFNNSLMAIRGYSELMLSRLDARDELYRDAAGIKKAADGAAALTGQLLAFSRKQVLQPTLVDLSSVVLRTQDMLERLIGEDIELRASVRSPLGLVNADRNQIEQVIVNLAVNARDAMPTGGTLTIETSDVELDESYASARIVVQPGSYVLLAVSDNGCGMDSSVRERVFEPFFTTKAPGEGTGMGLSTVYGIVKQSGGYIWAYSEPGIGSTFKVYLPRVYAPAYEASVPSAEPNVPAGSETVLLVEDQDEVRGVVRTMLERHGYRVLAAADAAEAVMWCERHGGEIDLLLTDVVMPGVSGPQLAERIGNLRPELKVLFMSGYTDDTIVHHGVLEEGVEFLQKPFTGDALAARIRGVLDAVKV